VKIFIYGASHFQSRIEYVLFLQLSFVNSREISKIPQTISHPTGFVIFMSHLSHFQFPLSDSIVVVLLDSTRFSGSFEFPGFVRLLGFSGSFELGFSGSFEFPGFVCMFEMFNSVIHSIPVEESHSV
jgi:hypothetical protein